MSKTTVHRASHGVRVLISALAALLLVDVAVAEPAAPPDLTETRRAADGGDAAAMFAMGEAHESGFGAKWDVVQAAQWYEKAVAPAQSIR